MIIGLSGRAQVGKDTVGGYLVNKYGFFRLAFADELKYIAGELGWDGKKDIRGRRLLQELGVTLRHYDENYWVQVVAKQLGVFSSRRTFFVITDVRFKNEAKWVLSNGGVMWRVEREFFSNKPEVPEHESETELDTFSEFSAVITNNGTFTELFQKVEAAYAKIV